MLSHICSQSIKSNQIATAIILCFENRFFSLGTTDRYQCWIASAVYISGYFLKRSLVASWLFEPPSKQEYSGIILTKCQGYVWHEGEALNV